MPKTNLSAYVATGVAGSIRCRTSSTRARIVLPRCCAPARMRSILSPLGSTDRLASLHLHKLRLAAVASLVALEANPGLVTGALGESGVPRRNLRLRRLRNRLFGLWRFGTGVRNRWQTNINDLTQYRATCFNVSCLGGVQSNR